VSIKKAFGGNNLWNYDEKSGIYSSKITHLYSGTHKDFVLELEIGPTGEF